MTNRDTTNPQEPQVDSAGGGATGEQEQDKTVVARAAQVQRDLENASPTGGNSSNRTQPATQNSMIGKWLDRRFEILEVVGTGGMSVVYKARQDVVDRYVAIKTLKMQLADQPETVQRFQREMKSLCRLSHPHIVTVFDCVIDEDGQPYIAMDFLDGKSLDVLLRERRRLTPEESLPFLVQICSALDHAHKHGIVHRDLKPSNIMLVGDDLEFVKVVDFGLARLGQENQKITRSGEIWGSPPYMSPEQCSGQPCDGRSDIYSLGVVMYEMLSGRDPFTSEQVVNTLLKHLNEPPPPFPPHLMIPQTWQYIIFKCLEKDPADRYQTMGALKEVLTSLSKQQSISTAEVRTTRTELPLPRSRAMDAGTPFVQTMGFKATVFAVTLGVVVCAFSMLPMHRATSDASPQATIVEPNISTPSPGEAGEPSGKSPAEVEGAAGETGNMNASTQTASAQTDRPTTASEQPAKAETPKAGESAGQSKAAVSAQKPNASPVHHKPPHVTHPAKPEVAHHPAAHHEALRHSGSEPAKSAAAPDPRARPRSGGLHDPWAKLKSDRSPADN